MLQSGGFAAVIIPDGVLFGSSMAHKALRKILVEAQKLDAIISIPSVLLKPYAGGSGRLFQLESRYSLSMKKKASSLSL